MKVSHVALDRRTLPHHSRHNISPLRTWTLPHVGNLITTMLLGQCAGVQKYSQTQQRKSLIYVLTDRLGLLKLHEGHCQISENLRNLLLSYSWKHCTTTNTTTAAAATTTTTIIIIVKHFPHTKNK